MYLASVGSKLPEQVQRGPFQVRHREIRETDTTTPNAEDEAKQTIPSYYACLSLILGGVLQGGVSLAHVIDNPLGAPRNVGRYLAKIAMVFAAQFAAGKLGDVLQTINSGGIGPVWPATGVALGAILLLGDSVWPGVAAGAFLLASLSPLPLWAAFAYATGTTLAALIAAFLLRHIVDFRPSLSRLRDVLGLILFGALGSAIVSASIGTSILYAARVRGWSGFGLAWLIYLLGDIMGVLLVTPVLLTFTDLLRIRPFSRIAELVAGQSLLVVVCFIIFGDLPLISVKLHILAFAVLPFVVGAAIRFGVSGAAVATLLIALIATIETALGSGPFASNNHFLNAVLLDVFFGVFSTLGLTLAAVISEKEQSEREREKFEREQAATEARLRFAAIVESCDDAIISGTLDGIIVSWNGGAQRIYEYTEAEAVGKPIAILLPPELAHEENKILETLRAGGRIEHFETIRITKTAKRINVSLTISPIKDSGGRTVGISGIARDITGRKLAEQAHQEIEDKLRLLLDSTAEAIYGIDLEHRCTFCNPACLRILGYERTDQVLGKNTHDLLHHSHADGTPFPIEECRVHRVTQTGKGVHSEDEVFWRANGTSFPVEYWSYPQRRGDEVVGAVVAFTDITERKLAEATVANVSRKLIEAQEQERTRIGRELHDDIGQRLAMIAIELQQLHPLVLPEVRSRMDKLQKQTSEIANDIQSLSHELHSAKLQYLGIVGAVRGFCREFGEQQKVEVNFQARDLPSPLSPDISLCLFRVLQEALHNAAKHSGVRHFEVELWGTSDEVHLTVRDSGAGFDREAAKESKGLGLISMEERLKLVNGTLSIESQLKSGTTIQACVRVGSGTDSMRAAG
jgi:PAS domain S-box-containing protein